MPEGCTGHVLVLVRLHVGCFVLVNLTSLKYLVMFTGLSISWSIYICACVLLVRIYRAMLHIIYLRSMKYPL
jgi:hypothetical protein